MRNLLNHKFHFHPSSKSYALSTPIRQNIDVRSGLINSRVKAWFQIVIDIPIFIPSVALIPLYFSLLPQLY